MKIKILYIILIFCFYSCCSSKKNIITDAGVINITEIDAIEVLYDSLNYDKENKILTISGRIIDLENGNGIWGANIVLFPQQQKAEGAASQKEGKFKIKIDTKKYDHFRISYLGYKNKVKYISEIITENHKK